MVTAYFRMFHILKTFNFNKLAALFATVFIMVSPSIKIKLSIKRLYYLDNFVYLKLKVKIKFPIRLR